VNLTINLISDNSIHDKCIKMISALHTSLIMSAQRYIEFFLKFAFISLFTAFEFCWLKLDHAF
jgi:hypothetical protein